MILEVEFRESSLSSIVDLNKFKVSTLHEETSEIEIVNFDECYATWLKDEIYVNHARINLNNAYLNI